MKSYEGLIGCKYPAHDVFVTSPNMKTLSHPLLGNQQIRMRQQLHFGEHDSCLVAQPFNEQTAYLCLIPYPYTSNATNTAPWTVPSESAFEPIDGHRPSQNPLGLIPEDSVCALETHFHDLSTSFSQLPPSERSISSFHSSRMKDYKNRIRFLLNRLRTPMLWDEAIHCLVCAQCCALELEALQSWVTSVGPTWDTQPFVVHALRDVVGALTEQPAVAQKLYQVCSINIHLPVQSLIFYFRLVYQCGSSANYATSMIRFWWGVGPLRPTQSQFVHYHRNTVSMMLPRCARFSTPVYSTISLGTKLWEGTVGVRRFHPRSGALILLLLVSRLTTLRAVHLRDKLLLLLYHQWFLLHHCLLHYRRLPCHQ